MSSSELCPVYAPFFGSMGATAAIALTCIGASYGTSKSGVGISAMGVLRPDLVMKCIVPVVMAGIIGIYGLVVSVLISGNIKSPMALYTGFIQLGAGLSVGLAGLSAGFAIGIVGDAGVRGTAQQPRLFVGMILILIFAEVLGLYGLIVALYMSNLCSKQISRLIVRVQYPQHARTRGSIGTPTLVILLFLRSVTPSSAEHRHTVRAAKEEGGNAREAHGASQSAADTL